MIYKENLMKVFDYSPIPFDGGNLSFQDRLKGIAKFGFSWVSEMKSQEVMVATLNRVLDHRFTLLRNIPLPGKGITVPLVLLGPHGVTVPYNSITKGVFRAEGDTWEVMDNRLKNFKPAKPNLITRTKLMTDAFKVFLTEAGREQEVDGVLVFTDPGTHVNSSRPDVRIILMDAIDRLGASLLQRPQILTMEDMRSLVDSITNAVQPKDITSEGDRIVPTQQFAENMDSGFMKALAPLQKSAKFSRRQWILLSGFAILDILILVGFVLYILFTA
jgi:hypothetical protein